MVSSDAFPTQNFAGMRGIYACALASIHAHTISTADQQRMAGREMPRYLP